MAQPEKKQKTTKAKTQSRWVFELINTLFIVAGIAMLLYPVISTLVNNYSIEKTADEYAKLAAHIKPSEKIEKILAKAHAYNKKLAKEGHKPKHEKASDPEYQEYLQLLSATETDPVMGKVVIPSIKVNLPIYHGTTEGVLKNGAGHLYGTDLPVGGLGTTSVISAHTGMTDATMFDNLPKVKDGAVIVLEIFNKKLSYRVTGREIVLPNQYNVINYDPSKDQIDLLTCTPYGINSHRLVVHAERLYPTPEYLKKKVFGPFWSQLQWWMWIDLVFVLCLLFLLFSPLIKRLRKQAKKQPRHASAKNGVDEKTDTLKETEEPAENDTNDNNRENQENTPTE